MNKMNKRRERLKLEQRLKRINQRRGKYRKPKNQKTLTAKFPGEITMMIKTLEREEHLAFLLQSIAKLYSKNVRILVADDSSEATKEKNLRVLERHPNVEYIPLPYDIGLPASRNVMLERITTKYFLHLDDDWCFTSKTDVDLMCRIMEEGEYDILAGIVRACNGPKNPTNWCGLLELDEDVLTMKPGAIWRGEIEGVVVKNVDITNNFWMGKTASVEKMRWDSDFKTGGAHLDFFLTKHGLMKIGFTPSVEICNSRGKFETREEYEKLRSRRPIFFQKFMEKHGLKEVVPFVGRKFENAKIDFEEDTENEALRKEPREV